jgi:hypothetical protein
MKKHTLICHVLGLFWGSCFLLFLAFPVHGDNVGLRLLKAEFPSEVSGDNFVATFRVEGELEKAKDFKIVIGWMYEDAFSGRHKTIDPRMPNTFSYGAKRSPEHNILQAKIGLKKSGKRRGTCHLEYNTLDGKAMKTNEVEIGWFNVNL